MSSLTNFRVENSHNGSELTTLLFESESQLESDTGLKWRLFVETPYQVFRLLFPRLKNNAYWKAEVNRLFEKHGLSKCQCITS